MSISQEPSPAYIPCAMYVQGTGSPANSLPDLSYHPETLEVVLQAPSPFLERLHLDAAELDPAPPVKQPGGIFSSSEEGRDPPASSHSMVGSMLSRVTAASPSSTLVP